MPIWSLIGAGLFGAEKESWWDSVFNTSYQSIIGNNIGFVFGGGMITNVYGYTINLQIDWESLISSHINLPIPKLFKNIGEGFLGSVGNTSIIYGDNLQFNYYGKSVTVLRSANTPIEIAPPKLYTIEEKTAFTALGQSNVAAKEAAEKVVNAYARRQIEKLIAAGFNPFSLVMVPNAIWYCLLAGILGIFATSVILRFYSGVDSIYNTSSSSPQTQMHLAIISGVISQAESSWISVLTMLETYTSGIVLASKDLFIKAQSDLAGAESSVEYLELAIKKTEDLMKTARPGSKVTLIYKKARLKNQLISEKAHVMECGETLNTVKEKYEINILGYTKY